MRGGDLLRRAVEPGRALRDALRNRNLRRFLPALGSHYSGEWAYQVGLGVFAYDAGGAAAVALIALVQMLPAAAAVPFAALLADRFRRERVLVATNLAKALLVAGAAVVAYADAPASIVFVLAGAAAVAAAAVRPTQWALLPLLTRTPRELVAANVSSSTIEGLGVFLGPAVAATLLAAGDAELVFAASSVAFALAAVLVSGARADAQLTAQPGEPPVTRILAGFRTLKREPHPRLVIALLGAQTFVRGMLNVLIVVVAIELVGLGRPGVGVLNSAYGVGALLGAVAALTLVGRARLGRPLAAGLTLWGLPIALIAVWPESAPAFIAIAIVGAGNSVLDVAGFTLVQRLVDDRVLGRVFGVLEMLVFATVGAGAIATSLLISAFGVRATLVVAGSILPALALLSLARLDVLDDAAEVPERELDVLRRVRLFLALPAPQIERLARRVDPVQVEAGVEIIRQGEAGDRFYVIERGEVEVSTNGAHVATLGPGDYFGEIALVHDVPRTATVRARTGVDLFALDRGDLIEAVTGNARSAETAASLIETRLEALRTLEHTGAAPR